MTDPITQSIITTIPRGVDAHRAGYRAGLDNAWHEINAKGGYVSPGDLAGNAYNKAILDALNIIENLGGMDPLKRGKE